MRKALLAVALLALVAVLASGPGSARTAGAPSGQLVLKFPVIQDFGGVEGKVLYVRQDLPEGMPLRADGNLLEAPAGFFPPGKYVSAVSSGSKLGWAVAGDGPFSVPISSPPDGGAVAVVESESELLSAGWQYRGTPEWSPGSPADLIDAFGVVNGQLAVLVEDPDHYGHACALARFDGKRWVRGTATFVGGYDRAPADVAVAGERAYVVWTSIHWYSVISEHSWSGDAVVALPQPPTAWGRLLHVCDGRLIFDNSRGTGRLYRWDQEGSAWIDCGASLGSGTYAEQGARLYGAAAGWVKEYSSGAWQDVFPLPSGVSVKLLAVRPDGTAWIADTNGNTWRRGPGDAEWASCGKPLGLVPAALAAMPDGSVWAAADAGGGTWAVARWNGTVWVDMGRPAQIPGGSVKLLPGPGGSLYLVGKGNWWYSFAGQGLYELPCALEP